METTHSVGLWSQKEFRLYYKAADTEYSNLQQRTRYFF